MTYMKFPAKAKPVIIDVISFLYILLFVYAAVSKLLDFEGFEIQLSKSPITSAFASELAVIIPLIEIFISALLAFRVSRFIGLLLSLFLMISFTVYIVVILNWSFFIPCSCGGILEKMGWTEHLIFNIFFILLALLGLLLLRCLSRKKTGYNLYRFPGYLIDSKRFGLLIIFIFFTGAFTVISLSMTADDSLQRNNAFQRIFPSHPLALINEKDLKYNSYYIAGISSGKIYLGNSSAPLHALEIDTLSYDAVPLRFRLKERIKKNYSYFQFRVIDSVFFLTDKSNPSIFRGTLGNWEAKEVEAGIFPFTSIEPTGFNSLVAKTISEKTGEDELAVITVGSKPKIQINAALLTRQLDGVFDTDGVLLYNPELKKIIYPYYYRNQYIVADQNTNLIAINRTIDTVTTATFKIAKNHSKNETTIGSVPLTINSDAATDGNFLYIKSKRVGKYEQERILKDATVIDVYNLSKGKYVFSFYLYNYNKETVRYFAVKDNLLIALSGHHLVTYRFNKDLLGSASASQ